MGGWASTGMAGEPWFAEVGRRHRDVDVVLLEHDAESTADVPDRPAAVDPGLVERECARLVTQCAEAAGLPDLEPTAPSWVPGVLAGTAQHVVGHHAEGVDGLQARSALGSLASALAGVGASPDPVPRGAQALRASVPTSVGAVRVSALHAPELGRWSVTVTSAEVLVDPETLPALLEGGAV